MVFVRVKNISGSQYGYLVENSWTGKGTRQKVGKYLGKVHTPSKVKSESLQAFLSIENLSKHVQENDFKNLAEDLVKRELHNHGVADQFSVNFSDFSVRNSKGKEVAIAMNNGFLCGHTMQQLLDYKPEQDYSGYLLADIITAAGILPEQDLFVELYGKFKAKHEAAAAKKFEFYY